MKPFKPLSSFAIAASLPIALLAADMVSAIKRRRTGRPTPGGAGDPSPGVVPISPQSTVQSTLSAVCRSVRDAILVTDAEGRVTQMNQSAQNMIGWTLSAAQGRRLDDLCTLIDEHTRRPLVGVAERIKGAQSIFDAQNRIALQHRAGHAVPIEAHGELIMADDGSLIGIALVLRDLSATREQEAQRRTLAARAEAACRAAEDVNRSRDEFMSFVAHQLRGPLNSIYGWVQLMQGGRLEAEQQTRALEAIARGTHAQTRLIDELLEASRALRGELRLQRSTVDVGVIARAALDSVRDSATARGIALDSSLAYGLCALADPQRLQQIVGQVLEHAIHSTPSGGSIALQMLRDDKEIIVRVSDSGIGFRAEDLPRIFEPFHRAAGVRSQHQGRGLGLGLAVAKLLTEQHGGHMRAHSDGPDQGATYTVRLPLLDQTRAPSKPDEVSASQ